MYCIKCGAELNANAVFCPKCGTKIDNEKCEDEIPVQGREKKKTSVILLSVSLFAVAFFCFFNGYGRITSSAYKSDIEYYTLYMEKYDECLSAAERTSSWIASSYKGLAYDYEKMAKDAKNDILKVRVETAVLCAIGVVSVCCGYAVLKKR